MGRIIQPIGDRIIIPGRKKKPSRKMWMGLEDHFPPRPFPPKLSSMSILTSGGVHGPSASPAAASCPADGSPDVVSPSTTVSEGANVGFHSSREAIGVIWTPPSTKTICKLGFYGQVGGDPDAISYRAVILLDADNTIITDGVSDITPGTEFPATYGWVYFDWTGSKPEITASTAYAFVVYRNDHAIDATDYISLGAHLQQAGNFEDIHNFHWDSDHWDWVAGISTADDLIMSVYYYD